MTNSSLGARAGVEGPVRAEVTLCRSLRVSVGDRSIGPRQLGGAKPRQILVALLLRPDQAVCKASLVRLLWDDAPPAGALSTLEGYVSLVRKRLDALAPGLGSAVRTEPGGYLLDSAFVDVDVHRFRRLAARARACSGPAAVRGWVAAFDVLHVLDALGGAGGPGGLLLPDEHLDWIEQAREELDAELLRALAEAAGVALDAGDLDRAHRWAREALAADPYDEAAWRVVLECCEQRGRYAEGLRAYDECRRLLADELGCTPGPGVREVFGRLLDGARQADDDPLSALVDAVVRLHVAVSLPAGPAGADPEGTTGPGRPGPAGQRGGPPPVEEDWRLLERLLSMARSGWHPTARATA